MIVVLIAECFATVDPAVECRVTLRVCVQITTRCHMERWMTARLSVQSVPSVHHDDQLTWLHQCIPPTLIWPPSVVLVHCQPTHGTFTLMVGRIALSAWHSPEPIYDSSTLSFPVDLYSRPTSVSWSDSPKGP